RRHGARLARDRGAPRGAAPTARGHPRILRGARAPRAGARVADRDRAGEGHPRGASPPEPGRGVRADAANVAGGTPARPGARTRGRRAAPHAGGHPRLAAVAPDAEGSCRMSAARRTKEQERRVALNEAVFRGVNEELVDLADELRPEGAQLDLICECG